MINYSGPSNRFVATNPKNGHERIVVDREDARHLEIFMNGSWRHIQEKCREYTNKDCRKKTYINY
jgi:hypothetical protein